MTDVRLALVTVPADGATGQTLARQLVEEKLAACVNRLVGAVSTYIWDGEVNEDGEEVLLIKTTAEKSSRLIERIAELHPYDVPEVLLFNVADGLPAYLDWVRSECG
ncbi:divalent-cation tolerance protein CutA [bacterium]|nr:divalent-cation tolerance protein CutA [bacterium]